MLPLDLAHPGGVIPSTHPLLMPLSSTHADRALLALLVLPAFLGPVVRPVPKVQLGLWARKVRR